MTFDPCTPASEAQASPNDTRSSGPSPSEASALGWISASAKSSGPGEGVTDKLRRILLRLALRVLHSPAHWIAFSIRSNRVAAPPTE